MTRIKVVQVEVEPGVAIEGNVKKEDLKRLKLLGSKPGTVELNPSVDITFMLADGQRGFASVPMFKQFDGLRGFASVPPDSSEEEVSQAIREKLKLFNESMLKNVWEKVPISLLYPPKKTMERWFRLEGREFEI